MARRRNYSRSSHLNIKGRRKGFRKHPISIDCYDCSKHDGQGYQACWDSISQGSGCEYMADDDTCYCGDWDPNGSCCPEDTGAGTGIIGKEHQMNPWHNWDPELDHQWCPTDVTSTWGTPQFPVSCQSSQDCWDYAAANETGWCGGGDGDYSDYSGACLGCANPADANGPADYDWGYGCCACWCQ